MQLGLAFNHNWETAVFKDSSSALMRKGRSNNNALQFSFSENINEKKIEPAIDLLAVIQNFVAGDGGRLIHTFTGSCEYGRFASATFSARSFSHCQVWCITNEVHIITATFICDADPSEVELQEVEKMVMSLKLVSDAIQPPVVSLARKASRWQFWRRR